ncbi:hypothetical protein ACLVWU_00860 [Bdellovibrio sp. HCB290]|uniref:hypothetical protein n=1 Tax=Bdellovibrio sp. HCB290 TaxID=3394356 RepID=UPI0039B480D1
MSRYHNHIVFSVAFSLVVGAVLFAEVSKDRPPAPKEIEFVDDGSGFSLATVLIEQELTTMAMKKGRTKQYEEQLRSQVKRLSQSDIKLLKSKAAKSLKAEERTAAAYLLSQAGPDVQAAQPARQIASASVAKKVVVPTKAVKQAKAKAVVAAKKPMKRVPAHAAGRSAKVAKR